MQDSVSEYTVKVHNGREEVDEKITIDAENETETLYIKDDGAPGEVYAIFDFKRVSRASPEKFREGEKHRLFFLFVCLKETLRNGGDLFLISQNALERWLPF